MITDAQVEAACGAWFKDPNWRDDPACVDLIPDMRAALEAAEKARGGADEGPSFQDIHRMIEDAYDDGRRHGIKECADIAGGFLTGRHIEQRLRELLSTPETER